MQRRRLDIVFPLAGVVRRRGVRAASDSRGPFPAAWATNVRLEDTLTNRLRGGSFTGISAGARPSEIVYRDRLVTFSGSLLSASRQGNHSDFRRTADVSDEQRPSPPIQLSEAGETGSTIVAAVPHKDAFLACFTAGETWMLQGDPVAATMRRVSDQVGIIGADAWCVAHDTLYFLSSSGLYSMSADGGNLTAISEDRIPEDLTGVVDSACTLTYNHADRGVYVHLTSGVSWFYDTAREAFWPFTASTTDSHVLLGPFRLGGPDAYGRVLRLHGTIAASSDSVAWRLVTGDSAEAAAANGKAAIEAAVAGNSYSSYVASEGTWTAGRVHVAYPRTRAVWCCVWLASEGDWAYEQVAMVTTTSGQWR